MNELNLPLLRKAVEWATAEAARPQVESEWFQGHYRTAGEDLGRSCGTAYCIAGWVNHSDGHPALGDWMHAADLLGISHVDAWGDTNVRTGLFESHNTIEDVRRIAERIARQHGETLR